MSKDVELTIAHRSNHKKELRRNLSGIFLLDQIGIDTKSYPTCFEECSEENQRKWLRSLTKAEIINVSIHLGKVLSEIGELTDFRKSD